MEVISGMMPRRSEIIDAARYIPFARGMRMIAVNAPRISVVLFM